ncbi:hypothetical protein NEDG_01092 [Nematocida displodere]|uniref:Transcription elongation factor 1 homolog n=1 Tax=Nematocida displodere TaxID=1805483 RepID=A0A177EAJ0_9MICR|nr:hypothetical protein NEDG_01092 [Nematocida displodere]
MARKKPQRAKRRVPPAPSKRFSCLECNRENVVTCTIDHNKGTGVARCLVCSVQFQCPTNKLSQAIDVYAEWVDKKG